MKLNTTLYLLIIGFIFSILVFAGSFYYTIRTEENLYTDFNDVEQTHSLMNELKKVANIIDNLETSYRSYRLSNDEDFLSMFNADEKLLIYEFEKIQKRIDPESEDAAKLAKLKELILERIKLGRQRIEHIRSGNKFNAEEKNAIDKEASIRIEMHSLIGQIIDHQQKQLETRHSNVVDRLNKTHLTIEIVGISAFILTILILAFVWQYNKTHSKIERDLIELNENKNKFFSIISHDLRGPVKNIVLMAQLLYQPGNKTIDPDKIAKLIESSANNLSSLLDNLLKWSRLQMNKIEFQPENFDLKKVADDVIINILVHAHQKSIEIENRIPEKTIVFADQNMISTVLRNLISNSLKFTEKGGMIEITGKQLADKIEISVNDNGVGMPREIANKIFSIDFKHTTKGTNKEEGTGLGLKLCKEFVEKNGGTIYVESTVGVGSKFIFTTLKKKA